MSGSYQQPASPAPQFSDENLVNIMGISMFNAQAYQPSHVFNSNSNHLPFFDNSPTALAFPLEDMESRPGQGATRPPTKHRRSRSGCLTCRQRRVKCDEVRPACERCRKGGRSCQYPGVATTFRAASYGAGSNTIQEESGSSPEAPDDPETTPSKSIFSNESDADKASNSGTASSLLDMTTAEITVFDPARDESQTPSLTHEQSQSPSSDGSESQSYTTPLRASSYSSQPRSNPQRRSNLYLIMQYYFMYFRGHLTHYHYGLKYDNCGFLHNYLLEEAANNEALMYAVVGFAAYHHSLSKPNGRLQDFLGFYTKSLSLLRRSLKTEKQHSVAILLTVLQLALLEEYLGDWTNLIAHQKAAHAILTDLFTPQTMMANDNLSKVLEWYLRFDLFAGFMSGNQPTLSRHWCVAQHQYYIRQIQRNPAVIGYKFEERICSARVLATDVNYLFAMRAQGKVADNDFITELNSLRQRFTSWYQNMDPSLNDSSKMIRRFSESCKTPDPNDIVDPFDTNLLYGDDLWPMNFVFLDFLALELMFQYQAAQAQRQPPLAKLYTTALKICQMFEAIEYHNPTPGVTIANQAPLAFAPLFLPKDDRFTLWFRKKFNSIESLGYIYPASFRNRLSDAWNIDVKRDWLPTTTASNLPEDEHPNENLPPMVRRIRAFIDYRTEPPKDQSAEILRDMNGIFFDLQLENDDPAPSAV